MYICQRRLYIGTSLKGSPLRVVLHERWSLKRGDINMIFKDHASKQRQLLHFQVVLWSPIKIPMNMDSLQIDRLVQERRNSSALAMQLRHSCTNPSRWQRQSGDFSMNMHTNLAVHSIVWSAGWRGLFLQVAVLLSSFSRSHKLFHPAMRWPSWITGHRTSAAGTYWKKKSIIFCDNWGDCCSYW